jgi:hypothetical protein
MKNGMLVVLPWLNTVLMNLYVNSRNTDVRPAVIRGGMPIISIPNHTRKASNSETAPFSRWGQTVTRLARILEGHNIDVAVVVLADGMRAKMANLFLVDSRKRAFVQYGLAHNPIAVHGSLQLRVRVKRAKKVAAR